MMQNWSKLFSKGLVDQTIQRKDVRISVEKYHQIKLHIGEQVYKIDNISISGLGIVSDDSRHFTVGEKMNAFIEVNQENLPIVLEIVHCVKNIIGARLIFVDQSLVRKLMSFFEAELKALSLREIERSSLKKDENGEPHWFYGDRNHEFYYTTSGDLVTSIQFNYHGHIVVEQKGKFHIGVQVDYEDPEKLNASRLVSGKVVLDEEFKFMMLRFISSIDEIPGNFKSQILSRLSAYFGVKFDA